MKFKQFVQIKPLKTVTLTLTTALTLALSANIVHAKTIAITNATVYTVASQGVLSKATVLIENDKIVAINPDDITADEVIDAHGRILTPGIIASMNSLGLVEVGAVSRTRDSSDKKADITFDASLAFNPKSTLIAYTRKGGITSSIVTPTGGESLFAGQTFAANLSGDLESIIAKQNGVLIYLGSETKGSRAQDLQSLDNKFADIQEKLDKKPAKGEKPADKLKRDEDVIKSLLAGEKPLLAYADRATDLLALLALKQKYGLNLVLVSASDAVLVADQIAAANVPVVMSSIDNLPSSFDSLHGSLSNMSKLLDAGVKVILAPKGESHNVNQLRYDAGVAVANGASKTDALAALTANVADVFNLNAGQIAVGKNADLVLWSADPFELSTKVDQMWINGKEVSTQSRQDALRDRYTSENNMPRAYIK
jgi:imidazolonepropionase-like amidohydrolase